MVRTRIIPTLLLRNESLVKTVKFGKFSYIGDPCNAVRIFNELEVDELVFLDILASPRGTEPNYKLLRDIADECFMPMGYGGGIKTAEQAHKIFSIGFEKVFLNTSIVNNPNLIEQISTAYGSQATAVSIDVKKNIFGNYKVVTCGGRKRTALDPVIWAKEAEKMGAGEILLTAVDCEGTWQGMDCDLISKVSSAVNIPVIAQGGAGNIGDIGEGIDRGGASAVALGSMVVFQKQGMGVLVNFPDKKLIEVELGKH